MQHHSVYLFLSLLLMGCTAAPEALNVKDFGAVEDADCTQAIQSALDACAGQGGGRVLVPAGHFESRTLYLRDGVELYLEEGAVLQGVEDPDAYEPYIPSDDLTRFDSGNGTANANCVNDRQWMKALIIGDGVKDAAIGGKGTLDGAHVFDARGEEGMRGPHTIIVACAEGFRLWGITVRRASNYAFLGYALDAPVFEDLTILEGWDGIHVRGADNAVIRRCRLSTGDDCIAGGYWNHMLIEDCDINSSCNGIRMIMPSDGVEVRHCHFRGPGDYPHRTSGEARRNNMLFGIALEPGAWGTATGTARGIWLHDLTMTGLSDPVATSVRDGSEALDLTLQNIKATDIKGALIPVVSWNDNGFRQVAIDNCTLSR